MHKVLLAIDGPMPNRKIFSYAVDLCQRITAELRILQVVRMGEGRASMEKVLKKTGRIRQLFENTMMAATFAESGEHETARMIMARARRNIDPLLPESTEKGVPFDLTLRVGDPEREFVDYIGSHRDVVITVCDIPSDPAGAPGHPAGKAHGNPLVLRLKEKIDIPVVALNDRSVAAG